MAITNPENQSIKKADRAHLDADTDLASEFAYYVLGVYDTLELAKSGVCYKEGVNRGQVADVVGKFLDDNPADRHLPAALLTMRALRSAFPCEQQ